MKGELIRCIDKLGDNHLKQRIAEATSIFSTAVLKSTLVKELSKRSSNLGSTQQEVQIDTTALRQPNYREIEESKEEPQPVKLGRRNRQVNDSFEQDAIDLENQGGNLSHQIQPTSSENRTLRKR